MNNSLGKTLLVVNPASQNGNGVEAGAHAATELEALLGPDSLTVLHTSTSKHANALAASSIGHDTVIVLGGDGTIHEAVNGLMKIDHALRPALGIIPCGTGNDFARALDMKRDVKSTLAALPTMKPQPRDLGICNGEYFMETLSFGLDADIALSTMELRQKTGHTGTLVFAEAGIDAMTHRRYSYPYALSADGGMRAKGHMLLFAVQVGPYYGGGFKICPEASATDNALDVCIAHPPLSAPTALALFALAKKGRHTRSKQLEFSRCKTLELEFDSNGPLPPVQIDGEALPGRFFKIESVPAALRVLS